MQQNEAPQKTALKKVRPEEVKNMDKAQLMEQLDFGENCEFEFKSSQGGVPHSLWETYSAMANTDGDATRAYPITG